jgi:hypothetical protein
MVTGDRFKRGCWQRLVSRLPQNEPGFMHSSPCICVRPLSTFKALIRAGTDVDDFDLESISSVGNWAIFNARPPSFDIYLSEFTFYMVW